MAGTRMGTGVPAELWQLHATPAAAAAAAAAAIAAAWRGPFLFAITGGTGASTPMLHRFSSAAEARRLSARKKHRLRLDGATVCSSARPTAAPVEVPSTAAAGGQLFPFEVSAAAGAVTWQLASNTQEGRSSWVAALAAAAAGAGHRENAPSAPSSGPEALPAAGGAGCSESVIAVFDFDHTLAVGDVCQRDLDSGGDIVAAFGGADRVARLGTMLDELRAVRVLVCILSYNSRATILRALDAVGLLRRLLGCDGGQAGGAAGTLMKAVAAAADRVVVGCEDYSSARGRGGRVAAISKSAEINARWLPAGNHYGGPRKLLFVDDDPQNCEDVAENCGAAADEVRVMHIDNGGGPRGDGGGMQAQDCAAVLAWARTHVQYM
eukprot:SAG22_NODE_2827_length_2174_cov_2.477108_2_plen_380_part_00